MPAEQDSECNSDVVAQKFGGIRKMEGSPATAEPSIFFVSGVFGDDTRVIGTRSAGSVLIGSGWPPSETAGQMYAHLPLDNFPCAGIISAWSSFSAN